MAAPAFALARPVLTGASTPLQPPPGATSASAAAGAATAAPQASIAGSASAARLGLLTAAAAAAVAGRRCGGARRRAARRGGVVTLRAAAAAAPGKAAAAGVRKPRVVVIGAGWGGWGAAKALSENGCDVTLLDSIPDPTGATPFLTPTGKPFEVGTRGFWKDYPNIEAVMEEVGVDVKEVLSEFTESAFYGPDGLEATAPVFSNSEFPQLPSPLGQVVASFSRFKRLPVADRLTMVGLLYAMLDFTRDEKTFEAYDRMSAHELFVRMKVSERLVNDFIRPTLLVGLFKPPEELSAAVAMELLYYYALAHQDSFDVRWMKKGTIQETLVCPLAKQLQAGGVDVRGGCRATELVLEGGRATAVRFSQNGKDDELSNLDAVVLALGAKGMSGLMRGSPKLARRCPELAKAASLGGIDVVATRIWLDRYIRTEAPANVLSKFEGLRGAGGTFFMLDQLQDDERALWGGEEPQGSVLACDFYNAGAIACLSDEDIINLLMRELLPEAVPAFGKANVVDSFVVRGMGAVTWFSPGSFRSRPPLETSLENVVCAGDWVRMGEREHGAKGLCQERAFVSGLEAANALARKGALGAASRREHRVLQIREDEPQVVAGRAANAAFMAGLAPFGLSSPWVR